MKRILILLSVLLTVQYAGAQSKASIDAVKNVDKAIEATKDPKKAAKPATWTKLAEAYIKAYEAPYGNVWVGMSQPEAQLLLTAEPPVSQEEVVLMQQPYTVMVFSDKKLYFDNSGMLAIIEVTKPAYTDIDPLDKAIDAYLQAGEIEVKEKGLAKIAEGLSTVAGKYFELAMNYYNLGDPQKASDVFMKSLRASENKIANKVDTLAIFNAAFTASAAGDTARAIKMFERCVEIGHLENGDVNARLGELYTRTGNPEKGKEVLEAGFRQFPQSQAVIIGLINHYSVTKEDPEKLFQLIAEAKANEPNNASLYYVEGDIYKNLHQLDKAEECYYKSYDIDNNYHFGLLAAGAMWYDEAVRVSELAQEEMDDKKYMAMVDEFEGYMLKAVDPFEKLFSVTEDPEFKQFAAEYLKSIYFRFRDRDAKYMAGYEKYNGYLESL